MKTKKEKLKQNNLSSKKIMSCKLKNWVANQNNERNKKFRNSCSKKKHFCVAKILLA